MSSQGLFFFPYTQYQFEMGHFPWDPLRKGELGLFLVHPYSKDIAL